MESKDLIHFIDRRIYSRENVLILTDLDELSLYELNTNIHCVYVNCKFDHNKIRFPKSTQVIRFYEEYDHPITDLILDLVWNLPHLRCLVFQYSPLNHPNKHTIDQMYRMWANRVSFNMSNLTAFDKYDKYDLNQLNQLNQINQICQMKSTLISFNISGYLNEIKSILGTIE